MFCRDAIDVQMNLVFNNYIELYIYVIPEWEYIGKVL